MTAGVDLQVKPFRLEVIFEGGRYSPSELRRYFKDAVHQALADAYVNDRLDQAVFDELSTTVASQLLRRFGT